MSGGYRRATRVYRLTYENHPGLWVRAKGATLGEFLSITELAEIDTAKMGVEELKNLFRPFADALVEWNLEYGQDGPDRGEGPIYREGDPVPATVDGLLSQDLDFLMELMMGWTDSLVSVDANLSQPSTSGSLSLVESLPMDVSSPSQAS